MTGKGLQAWRQQNGYTQHELAQALKMDTGLIIKWEREIRSSLPPYLQVTLNALTRDKKDDFPDIIN